MDIFDCGWCAFSSCRRLHFPVFELCYSLSPRSLTRILWRPRITTTLIRSTSLLLLFDVYLYSIDRGGSLAWIPSPILFLPAQKLRLHLRFWVVLSHCEGGKEEGPATPAHMGRRTDDGEASGGSRRKPPAEVPFLSREEVCAPLSLTFVCRPLD